MRAVVWFVWWRPYHLHAIEWNIRVQDLNCIDTD